MPGWPGPGTFRSDLLWVLCGALAVVVVFPDRSDWASHVVAGGGVVLAVTGGLGRRFGRLATTGGLVLVLWLAVVVEATVTGPFDPADLAFTVAGGLLVAGESTESRSTAGGSARWAMVGWGVALVVFAVANRYGIRRGP